MAWNRRVTRSPEPLENQEFILGFFASLRNFFTSILRYLFPGACFLMPDESNLEQPTDDQLERAKLEISKILKDVTGGSKAFSPKFSELTKNKRIPRLYYINNDKSILIILQGDITRTKVDAIVNAANEHMTGGSGVDGMVHHAAGNQLYNACKAHKEIFRGVRLPTGHSRILLSYNMSPTTYYIINTAGPMYYRRDAAECAKQLSSCYKTALSLASLYDLESIAFTAISCGIFGYPADDGADVALRTVDKCAGSVPVVVFVLWDDNIYDAWFKKVKELNFTPFDSESPITEKPAKSENDDHRDKDTKNPTTKHVSRQSSTDFNPPVTDLSTHNEKDKKPDDEGGNLFSRLPSVPTDTSDTQNTETMDQDSNPTDSDARLTSQRTAQMTNAESTEDDPTTIADSESPTEANKSNGKQSKTENKS